MGFMLGFPNLIDSSASVTGGSWTAGGPANRVRTWPLAETAISADALDSSTRIRINHGSAKSARALALVRHNLSSAATIRWTRGTTAAGSDVADSGVINAWQFAPRAYDGAVYDIYVIQANATSAQYDEILIVDTANSDGYVEVGRVFVGPTVTPTYNPAYGLVDGHVDLSTIGIAHSGATWPAAARRLRQVQFELTALSLSEGNTMHELEQVEGTTGEVLHLPYWPDRATMQQYGMLSMVQSLNGILYPRYNTRSKAFSLKQRA